MEELTNSEQPGAAGHGAAANTIATTNTISAVLIRRYASTENRGGAAPRVRAMRTRMNVIIGVNSSENTLRAHRA